MTQSQRQHGIGSLAPDEQIVGKPGGIVEAGVKQYGIFKKIKKGAKKLFKSKLGKAALIGGIGAFGLGSLGGGTGWGRFSPGMMKKGLSKLGGWGASKFLGKPTGQMAAGQTGARSGGLWNWIKGNKGQAAMLGLGAAGMAAPFFGGKDDDDEDESPWHITPPSIANIRNMARARDSSLAFLPPADSVQSGYYLAEGGLAGLANGGGAANAQAEQMLKMEYQKYRNQGGTMSYQQFKMAVLQQAQGQGPMAQGQSQMAQPQMAAHGGRIKYQGGELVEDASMIEETPTGMMEENVEEVQGEPTREQMEALAMEIFQLRLEELDEEQLMIVYQAAMEQKPREEMMQEEDIQFNPQMAAPQMAANGGRMGFQEGGWNPGVGRDAQGYQSNHPSATPNNNSPVVVDTHVNNTNTTKPKAWDEGYEYQTNWRNIFPGGKPFRTYGLPTVEDEENLNTTYTSDPSGTQNLGVLHPNAKIGARILSNQEKKNERLTELMNMAQGGRAGLANGGLMGSHVRGYTTPPGYNRFDYPSGGVRVGRAEGGIMDLGGMEKDYRQEGGFVPLGGEEKADDVPARLSKNEFVFTADAVRNAGGGDIDSGAEVMQNMMENLESGGQISEDSQGGGGEEMISEEEIIEEPNGAQEMYDQQQMLQSRMG